MPNQNVPPTAHPSDKFRRAQCWKRVFLDLFDLENCNLFQMNSDWFMVKWSYYTPCCRLSSPIVLSWSHCIEQQYS